MTPSISEITRIAERLLGKVPAERKKTLAAFYTPDYIVNYIVKETVGKQIEGRSPLELRKMGYRVLDPACGNGIFCVGAYRYLLTYSLDWYTTHSPERHKNAVSKDRDGVWHLSFQERSRILRAHIFGVDIDPQAVELTKLALLLECGELSI